MPVGAHPRRRAPDQVSERCLRREMPSVAVLVGLRQDVGVARAVGRDGRKRCSAAAHRREPDPEVEFSVLPAGVRSMVEPVTRTVSVLRRGGLAGHVLHGAVALFEVDRLRLVWKDLSRELQRSRCPPMRAIDSAIIQASPPLPNRGLAALGVARKGVKSGPSAPPRESWSRTSEHAFQARNFACAWVIEKIVPEDRIRRLPHDAEAPSGRPFGRVPRVLPRGGGPASEQVAWITMKSRPKVGSG